MVGLFSLFILWGQHTITCTYIVLANQRKNEREKEKDLTVDNLAAHITKKEMKGTYCAASPRSVLLSLCISFSFMAWPQECSRNRPGKEKESAYRAQRLIRE
jgi:hypothetical protein